MMSNNLIQFDPNLFKRLNPSDVRLNSLKTKVELYEYYKKNRNHMLSNLNLHPKYRKKIENIMRIDYYNKHVYPVKNELKMYEDLFYRLQYTPLLEMLLEQKDRSEAVRSFYGKSGINELNDLNYCIVKLYPGLFFQYVSWRYFETSYWKPLLQSYESYYLEDAISSMIKKIGERVAGLSRLKKETKLLVNENQRKVFLIKCYDLYYVNMVRDLLPILSKEFFVLIEYPSCDADALKKMPLIEHQKMFYHFKPDQILYLGDLDEIKESVIFDRSEYPDTIQRYFVHNCYNIESHLIPLMRLFEGMTTILHSLPNHNWLCGRESWKTSDISTIGSHEALVNLQNFLRETRRDMLAPLPPLFYAMRVPKCLDKFAEYCNKLEVDILFIFPKTNLYAPPIRNVVYLPLDVLMDKRVWSQCKVFLEFEPCISYHVYYAIKCSQLLLLPQDNCIKGGGHYSLDIGSTRASKSGRDYSYFSYVCLDGDNVDDLLLNSSNSEIDYNSFFGKIVEIHKLLTDRNLDSSKYLHQMRRKNRGF